MLEVKEDSLYHQRHDAQVDSSILMSGMSSLLAGEVMGLDIAREWLCFDLRMGTYN